MWNERRHAMERCGVAVWNGRSIGAEESAVTQYGIEPDESRAPLARRVL